MVTHPVPHLRTRKQTKSRNERKKKDFNTKSIRRIPRKVYLSERDIEMISFMSIYNLVLHTTISAIFLYLFSLFFNTFFDYQGSRKLSVFLFLLSEAVLVASIFLFPDSIFAKVVAGMFTAAIVSCLYSMKWYYHIIIPLALYARLILLSTIYPKSRFYTK